LTVVLLILIALFLLLLFLPVSKEKLANAVRTKAERIRSEVTGYKIGDAGYEVLSASMNDSLFVGNLDIGNRYVLITARITNLVSEKRLLDYSNIQIKDKFERRYPVNISLTEQIYEREKKVSPWDEWLKPGKTKIVKAGFIIPMYISDPQLDCRDFDWTRTKSVSIPLTIAGQKKKPAIKPKVTKN
jgi:hypothetical protein